MQDIKQNLADAVREARTKLGLSQEQLAEILAFDSRTILNIENGRGNPKFENLCALIRYLNLTDNKIFYPDRKEPRPNHERLLALLDDCTGTGIRRTDSCRSLSTQFDANTQQANPLRKPMESM